MASMLLVLPAAASDDGETRSTVEFGPDLAVSAGDIELSKQVLLAGVDFNVSVKVYNLGDEDASSVAVDLLVDTKSVQRKVQADVMVDSWVKVEFQLTLSQGDHDIGMLVDADDAIDERQEDNNRASISVRVRGLPDASISDDDVSVSDAHPEEGDVVTIDAMVHNLGESAATLVVVQFWDGAPDEGYLIANRTTSVPEMGQKMVSTDWDTSDMGGTHEISIYISRVLPGEDETSNNMASVTVLVFTTWDLVVDGISGDVVIQQDAIQDGFVTVRDGHTLTISDVTFDFLQDYSNQFAIFVENGGMLVLDGATVRSDLELLVFLEDGTSLLMSSEAVLAANVQMTGDVTVTIEDSFLDGSLQGGTTQVTIIGSEVTGTLELTSGSLTVEESYLSGKSACVLEGTSAVLTDTAFTGGAGTSLRLFSGASVELHNVTCNLVDTDETSSAYVFRRVEVTVVDESTMVIPHASIDVCHYINGSVVASAEGGDDGKAELEVLSDVIRGGQAHFIGNYRVMSTYSDKEGSEPLLLTPFPAMHSMANLPKATVVLPPVEPRTLVTPTKGDLTVESGEDLPFVADFVQDGNIVVLGTLTVSQATLTVLQEREHEFYVVVEGSGKLILNGAKLTSTMPLNVYLYDEASLIMDHGSSLDVNALVAEDGASITGRAASLSARVLLRGGHVSMESGCDIEGDLMVVEAPTVSIVGGSIFMQDIFISAPATAIEGVELSALSVHLVADFANVSNSRMTMSYLLVEATILTVTGSQITSVEPLNLSVATFYMDTSSSNVPLDGGSPDAKVYLYDADMPDPISLGDATVLVFWYLRITVEDVLANPVADSTVVISYTNNDTLVATGETNDDGKVRFPLLGSIIDADGEYFVGNYRIEAISPKDPDETVVRYVNLDMGKALIVGFDMPMVPPTMISVEIWVENTTLTAREEFVIYGAATAVFPTVRSALTQGVVEVQLWTNGSTWSETANVSADGTFEFVVPGPDDPGVYYAKAVVTPTGDFAGVSPGVSNHITLDVEPPGPISLFVVLTPSMIPDFPAGDLLIVKGHVRYNDANGAPAANVKVFVVDAVDRQTYQVKADGLGVFEFPPRTGPSFYGQYDYLVTAKDVDRNIETPGPVKLTVIAVEPPVEETEDRGWLMWSLIIIIVVVAVVAGTLGYWAFSSKGRMVECGECGTLVPETATECPKCGIEFEVEVAKCSECESWIRSDADVCPYCSTPFRDLEGELSGDTEEEVVDEGEGPVTVDAEEGDVTAEDIGEDDVLGEMDLDANGEEPSPEAAKQVPEGLKKEVVARPVVTRKAVKEVHKDNGLDDAEPPMENGGENGQVVVRPRVVKKVAAPPAAEEPMESEEEMEEI